MKKLILILTTLILSASMSAQVIYTFDAKTPVLPGDLLLGTDSVTLQTSNFRVRDIGATLIDLYGIANDTTVFTTKNYSWISSEPDSIAVAFENLSTYAANLHLTQEFSGDKTFSGLLEVSNTSPAIRFNDGINYRDLTLNPTSNNLQYGGNYILDQSNVSAGANITISTTATGISISSSQITTIDEGFVRITGTYSNLGILPNQNQSDFNFATDAQIGVNIGNISTNSTDISTNAGNISVNSGNISTNSTDISTLQADKADKTNVLELDNTTSFTPDADYEPATKKYVDEGGAVTSWQTITPVSSDINTTESQLRACQVGTIVYITGRLRLDSAPSEDDILYTLPSSFSQFTETIYFSAGDAGSGDDNIELKAPTGTRNIVAGEQISVAATCSYNESIPVI